MRMREGDSRAGGRDADEGERGRQEGLRVTVALFLALYYRPILPDLHGPILITGSPGNPTNNSTSRDPYYSGNLPSFVLHSNNRTSR